MSLNVPLLFLLSHAMHVNHEKADRKFKREQGKEERSERLPEDEGVPTFHGKPVSELNSQEMKLYFGAFFQGE